MYGRTSDLARLNRDRNNTHLPKVVRNRADKAHAKIVEQLKDRKLMGLRARLMKATKAGDMDVARKIEMEMRAYLKDDQETGT